MVLRWLLSPMVPREELLSTHLNRLRYLYEKYLYSNIYKVLEIMCFYFFTEIFF